MKTIHMTKATVICEEWVGDRLVSKTVVAEYTEAIDGRLFYDSAVKRNQQLNSFGRDGVMSRFQYRVIKKYA